MASADYQSIAVLFADGHPTGADFRQEQSLISVYREIKDMRSAARADDRSRENDYLDDGTTRATNEAVNQPSELWHNVHDMCLRELTTRTKDIELISWLAEATVRTSGLLALSDVFSAAKALIVDHLQSLHPSSEADTPADRISSLAGLNGSQDSDGTLMRPLYLTPLAPDQIYGRACLWHYNRAVRANDGVALGSMRELFSSARIEGVRAMRAAASRCIADINAIDSHVTEVYKADAPSFRRLRDIFQEIHNAYADLAMNIALAEVELGPEVEQAVEADSSNAVANTRPAQTSGINDREQAFQTLLQIASFFRRTEPHSSIPLALETVVRRGRMDFMGLLLELVPDENQRREVLTRAGIEPRTTQDTG